MSGRTKRKREKEREMERESTKYSNIFRKKKDREGERY